MLGRRTGIPDPPRPVSQYQGWKPVGCDQLWDFYNDRFRDGGSLGEIDGSESRQEESVLLRIYKSKSA